MAKRYGRAAAYAAAAVLVAGAVGVGCGDDTSTQDLATSAQDLAKPADLSASSMMATATINKAGGAQGTATFVQTAAGLVITLNITGGVTPDGNHGWHLHMNGDCGDTTGDGGTTHGAAGGHFNPDNVAHACPPTTPRHAGDLGNIMITAGAGTATITSTELTLTGAKGVVGKALILHAAADDCTTQPTGNSGARLACSVIAMQ